MSSPVHLLCSRGGGGIPLGYQRVISKFYFCKSGGLPLYFNPGPGPPGPLGALVHRIPTGYPQDRGRLSTGSRTKLSTGLSTGYTHVVHRTGAGESTGAGAPVHSLYSVTDVLPMCYRCVTIVYSVTVMCYRRPHNGTTQAPVQGP